MSKLADKIKEGGDNGRHLTAWETELLLSLDARIEALEPKEKAKEPDKKGVSYRDPRDPRDPPLDEYVDSAGYEKGEGGEAKKVGPDDGDNLK